VPTAPFGSWPSPVTSDVLVSRASRLADVLVDGADVYWVEGRPAEEGRQVLVRWRDGQCADAVGAPFSVRTLVHEYGGRAAAARDGVVFACNLADQRLWRFAPGAAPSALTPEPAQPFGLRYADPDLSPDGRWLYCVREAHGGSAGEAVNEVVRVAADGGGVEAVAGGTDFVAAPRVSPDGDRLAWLAWSHPNMPWDGTELWVAAPDGTGARLVAGGPAESVSQPWWSPDGRLHYLSDRTGWWNLYAEGDDSPLVAMDAEFGGPDWNLGQSSYAFLSDGVLVATWQTAGRTHLGVVGRGDVHEIGQPFDRLASLQPVDGGVVCLAGGFAAAPAVVRIGVPDGAVTVLARAEDDALDPALVSVPRPIEFPTSRGETAHAFFYPPRNRDWTGPPGERPPLVVMSHGGPTAQARTVLDPGIQWWTTRGIAVVDVDYRGSSGYGRAYRTRLEGEWGVLDVDDCLAAARWLADEGLVDGDRMVIRGESASGLTVLCALAFGDVFAAGASHYGVGDLAALARDTHKFESRYIDRLVGPLPAAADVYRARSPVFHADRIKVPIILFQGLEDKVVPPQQAEQFAAALEANGVPYEYLAFEGEQHGFRQADTIKAVAEAELAFFGRVLGFAPAPTP